MHEHWKSHVGASLTTKPRLMWIIFVEVCFVLGFSEIIEGYGFLRSLLITNVNDPTKYFLTFCSVKLIVKPCFKILD